MQHETAKSTVIERLIARVLNDPAAEASLVQWAKGLLLEKEQLQKQIDEKGGTWNFPALFTTEGEYVPTILDTSNDQQYVFMVCNNRGEFTGKFAPAFPKRKSTLLKRGYTQGVVVKPAMAMLGGDYVEYYHAMVVATTAPHVPPIEIVTTDIFNS